MKPHLLPTLAGLLLAASLAAAPLTLTVPAAPRQAVNPGLAEPAAGKGASAKTFIDYFLPIPARGPLSSETWGAPGVLPRDPQNGLEDMANKFCYWDGQIIKGPDGRYHIFASRWDESKGHNGWGDSLAVHAVSDNLFGPYVDKGLCWPDNQGGRGHNVTALVLPDGRYAIVVSETRPGTVFVSKSLDGPWEELGPIVTEGDVRKRASNYSVMVRPDGDFMIVPRSGQILLSKTGILGPYRAQGPSIYPGIAGLEQRNLEDPVVWFSGGLYHIVVNSWSQRQAFHLTSQDGITGWTLRGLAYDPRKDFVRYTDGTVNRWDKLERPGVVLENGHVVAVTLAVLDVAKNEEKGHDRHGSKVIVLPFDGAALDRDLGATFRMGTARAPDGRTLALDARSLILNGKPWTPVMGEFHYSRYPENEWRGELLKMKAGGIDIVATYVFWIHHEEIEGQWEWSGQKSLRKFIETAAEVGLKAIVRCGPWCHGEVRSGGLPDWVVARGQTRTEDPAFIASTTKLYHQIAAQLKGLLWKDGGPVIGIQLDNEYGGPASYLLTLKQIARDAGLDVPLYTRTGWPALSTPMPFGEIVPLYGVYAEGFWDRELTSMPGNYWAGFHFSKLRVDANIANEALGRRDAVDAPDVARYPYLTCEIGGGMMSSYHRRILVDPRDITSTTLVKLGSGSVSPGYYMYHGGTNPEGKLTTLMEEQATAITNWNDMPVKNYDFQTALGQYGQVRPQFFSLRPLHLFLKSFGDKLAGMDTVLPDVRPAGKDDVTTLRWAARSDGRSGFVFVNNYERSRALPAKADVQFALQLADGRPLTFPDAPVTIPADAHFFWPFNLDLGAGVTLRWATAQPVAVVNGDNDRTVYFAETPGITPQFCFGPEIDSPDHAAFVTSEDRKRIYELSPGQTVRVIPAERASMQTLRLAVLSAADAGRFGLKTAAAAAPVPVAIEQVKSAGPLRTIAPGRIKEHVAAAPGDADFAAAAVWRIKLPANLDLTADPLLRLHYTGDVARVYLGKKFITDDYYNGLPLEIGLRRHAADLKDGELTVAILPLQKNAPIFMAPSARPDFGSADRIAVLRSADLVPNTTVETIAQP